MNTAAEDTHPVTSGQPGSECVMKLKDFGASRKSDRARAKWMIRFLRKQTDSLL